MDERLILQKLDRIIFLLEKLVVSTYKKELSLHVGSCPTCGETKRLEDTGTFDNPRTTCLQCGVSFRPALEATA